MTVESSMPGIVEPKPQSHVNARKMTDAQDSSSDHNLKKSDLERVSVSMTTDTITKTDDKPTAMVTPTRTAAVTETSSLGASASSLSASNTVSQSVKPPNNLTLDESKEKAGKDKNSSGSNNRSGNNLSSSATTSITTHATASSLSPGVAPYTPAFVSYPTMMTLPPGGGPAHTTQYGPPQLMLNYDGMPPTNGHLSPVDSNGTSTDASGNTSASTSPGQQQQQQAFVAPPAAAHHMHPAYAAAGQPTVQPLVARRQVGHVRVGSGGHSPPGGAASHFVPAPTGSRGSSPGGAATTVPPGQQQHVVHVHVNPGETFSVRVGEQIQHIPGPATVRMVSNNGPPLPMPMQVPPGHMVQQIVDENGILTHVILSPQPGATMAPAAPPHGLTNSGSCQFSSVYGGGSSTGGAGGTAGSAAYTAYNAGAAAASAYPAAATVTPAQAPLSGTTLRAGHGTPPPHPPPPQSHHCSHSGAAAPSGAPVQHVSDERAAKQKAKLQDRLRRRHLNASGSGYHHHTHQTSSASHAPSHDSVHASPRASKHKVNGTSSSMGHSMTPAGDSSSSSMDGDVEEERRVIRGILSKIDPPKVQDQQARSNLVKLTLPVWDSNEFEIHQSEFKYELHLSDRGRDGKYKVVYTGDATEITLKDLKPATEYHLKVLAMLDDMRGALTSPVAFRTTACEPDQPDQPKLSHRSRTSLVLKWNAAADNGSRVLSYVLECDNARGGESYSEVYNGPGKHYKVSKLHASTSYSFRLCATNAVGKSPYSNPVTYCTSGSVPLQPDPPMLSETFVNALHVSWIRRPNDEDFFLQMDDTATGHGFLSVFNGSELSHKVETLRRNTKYKFRLCAENEEGKSPWSDVVVYSTLPEAPGAPSRPSLLGKVHSTSFRITWMPPRDTGGAEVTKYSAEIDDNRGFQALYSGANCECKCDGLQPGTLYRLRVRAHSTGGSGSWSDTLEVRTQAVVPGPCAAPRLFGPARASTMQLRWARAEYDGGACIRSFEVQLSNPDGTQRQVYSGVDTECTVAGLLPGRPYLLQVRALNDAGAGPWSPALEAISGPGVPDAPAQPTCVARSAVQVLVTWTAPVNNGATINEYRLEWRQADEGGDFTLAYAGDALQHEVKQLQPMTSYVFRVQAVNVAGPSSWSGVTQVVMPASSPGVVTSLRVVPTADTIQLAWTEPSDNGAEIVAYNIEVGEHLHIAVEGNQTEYLVDNLSPETVYRIRVQAVNSCGTGPFSNGVKVTTRSLPPPPPRLDVINCLHNNVKLRWGDGKNPDMVQYVVEMLKDYGRFVPVYHGPNHSYKVQKLAENTEYEFRIRASNEAGDGPFSESLRVCTRRAPPPVCKPPKVSEVDRESAMVEWPATKAMGHDQVFYCLQLTEREGGEFRELYRGLETSHRVCSLTPRTDYQVRVCAVRECADGSELSGAFSTTTGFSTHSLARLDADDSMDALRNRSGVGGVTSLRQPRPRLSDHQWAGIIMMGFTLIAVVIALIAQQVITISGILEPDLSVATATTAGGEAAAAPTAGPQGPGAH